PRPAPRRSRPAGHGRARSSGPRRARLPCRPACCHPVGPARSARHSRGSNREPRGRSSLARASPCHTAPLSRTMISPSPAHDTRIEVLREQLEQQLHPIEVREALALVLQQVVLLELLPGPPEHALTEPLVGQHSPEEALHRLLRHRPLHAPQGEPCRRSTSLAPTVYFSGNCQKVREKAITAA